MRTIHRVLVSSAVAAMALALVHTPASAQRGMTVWAGAGGSSPDGSMTFGRDTKQLGIQLALPIIPVAVRADAMMFGSKFTTDAVSYNVNAVFQMRLPIVTPYGMIGTGKYAVAPNQKVSGFNVGAGARVGLGRFGVFGEVRRHDPIGRTVTLLGVTF